MIDLFDGLEDFKKWLDDKPSVKGDRNARQYTEIFAGHLEIATYLTGLDNPKWKWLIEPEALYGKGGWRAYGRI